MPINSNRVIEIQQREVSGPLPTPEVLADYNKVCPNAAERIIALAEAENRHRHSMEEKESSRKYKITIFSILSALLTVFALSAVIFSSVYYKNTSAAVSTSIAAIAGVIGIFIYKEKKTK